MESITHIIIPENHFAQIILEPLSRNPAYRIYSHRRARGFLPKLKRTLRFLLPGSHKGLWAESILGKDYRNFLSGIGPGDNLIIWSHANLKDVTIISEEADTSAICVMLWDPLRQICHFHDREIRAYPKKMGKLGVNVFTFDKVDAEKYGFNYVGQVYRRLPDEFFNEDGAKTPDDLNLTEGKVFFLGCEKGRGKIFEQVATRLEEEGIPYRFMLYTDGKPLPHSMPRLRDCVMGQTISYKEVIRHSQKASCLLDILQPGQSGMTLRTLEALFLNKKLITNNQSIKAEPFFHPDNIYILGDPQSCRTSIREFLEIPFHPVDEKILDLYDIVNWIERLKH